MEKERAVARVLIHANRTATIRFWRTVLPNLGNDESSHDHSHDRCEAASETNLNTISAAAELTDKDMIGQNLSKDITVEEQQKDLVLSVVFQWISDPDCVPPRSEIFTMDPEIRDLYAQNRSLEIRDGILYRQFLRPDECIQYYQLVIPRALRTLVLENVHSDAMSGHFGVRKTQEKLQKYSYWRGHKKDVDNCSLDGVQLAAKDEARTNAT